MRLQSKATWRFLRFPLQPWGSHNYGYSSFLFALWTKLYVILYLRMTRPSNLKYKTCSQAVSILAALKTWRLPVSTTLEYIEEPFQRLEKLYLTVIVHLDRIYVVVLFNSCQKKHAFRANHQFYALHLYIKTPPSSDKPAQRQNPHPVSWAAAVLFFTAALSHCSRVAC